MNSLNISGKVDDGGNNMKDYRFVNADFEGSMSVPTQLLTEGGRAQIKDAYENFGSNSVTAGKGAWGVTPMGVARRIDASNGDENGMPSLVPSLFREKSKTGREFKNREDGKYYESLGNGEYKLIGDGTKPPSGILNQYDSNPVLKLLWHFVPGFASFTKWHDKSVDTGTILPQNKTISIPGYLATSLYGSVGTPINTTYDFFNSLFTKPNVETINSPNTSSK